VTNDELIERVRRDVTSVLHFVLPNPDNLGISGSVLSTKLTGVVSQITEDLNALANRDAAADSNPMYVYDSYLSFRSVLAYRVASMVHGIAREAPSYSQTRQTLLSAARRISEISKVETGIEIHPAARIGRRFVIDHGSGTVIGEQAEIGDDCYILQNVTLGGVSVGNSREKLNSRRHPRVGNRVEIAGGVVVFGPVTIGDDCRLEGGARITTDIPSKSRVRVISTVQVTVTERCPEVHGVVPVPDGLLIAGAGLDNLRPALLDCDYNLLSFLHVRRSSDVQIRCSMPRRASPRAKVVGLFENDELVCCITAATALRRCLP
jgi:serine O-acetyltransferase